MAKRKNPKDRLSEKIDFMERKNILKYLEQIAETKGLNVSSVIRIAVREYIKRQSAA